MDSRFFVVATVRDVERTVERDLNRIELALSRAKCLHWFLVESDSKDDTLGALARVKKKRENFDFISFGKLSERLPARTDRLAFCRNRTLDELRENPKYQTVDFVVVVDLDGINLSITAKALETCWRHDRWSVMTANQSGPYYDIFALRHEMWSPVNPLAQYEFLNSIDRRKRRNRFVAVRGKMLKIPASLDPIEVDSAFGGLAIYSRDALTKARYSGFDQHGREDCEHVELHRQIRSDGGRIFINPAMVNARYTEHSRRLWELISLYRRLKERFSRLFEGKSSF